MVPLKQLTGAEVGQPSQSHAFPLVLVVTGLAHAFCVVLESWVRLPKVSASLLRAVPSRSRCLPMATQSGHLIGIRCEAVLGVHVDGLRLGGRVSDAALL